MILGSDSHTRYGALGTMAMGEGGPEIVKQLLEQTYDIPMPGVVAIHLTGKPEKVSVLRISHWQLSVLYLKMVMLIIK